MKRILIVVLVALIAPAAYAGTPVRGVDKDLGVALDKTVASVEQAAAVAKTCVSEYPSLDTCREAKGYWECTAIRADHKGSCATRPSDLDNLIKAANGLSGAAARAAAAAKVGP